MSETLPQEGLDPAHDPAADDDLLPHEMPPDGTETGLREGRTQLGAMADRARWKDEITYLTRSGTRVAAIVPAAAARTLAQTTEAIQTRRGEEDRAEQHLADVIAELHRQVNNRDATWARVVLELCIAVEDLAETDPSRAELALRRVGALREAAKDISAGKQTWG